MSGNPIITQVCVVVEDIKTANAGWAHLLGLPEAAVEIIFPDGILHYTAGHAAAYKDCQVAKYQLAGFVLEILQPGPTPSPWRAFLERNGPGVFHFCIQVDDRKQFQHMLSDLGVGMPYHLGYFPGGSYSYVDAKEQLGLELSVNTQADYQALFQGLAGGTLRPMDEMR